MTDPEAVLLLADEVVEEMSPRAGFVHPSNRLETVQVVLGRLALDVVRLVGEELASRVHALPRASRTAVTGCCASQSISRSGWSFELVCDCGVALRVTEPDRGRDVERALRRDLPRTQRLVGFEGAIKSRRRRLTFTDRGRAGSGRLPERYEGAAGCLASAAPRECGVMRSVSQWTTRTGHRTRPQRSPMSCSLRKRSMDAVISVSGSVSSAQPTTSSICFVSEVRSDTAG